MQKFLRIVELESNPKLQDAVLSVHHACMLTVGNTPALKLIENHNGIAHLKISGKIQIPFPLQMQQPQPPTPPSAPVQPSQPVRGPIDLPFLTRLKIALQILFGRLKPSG
jgi:hypothetical protein